MLELRKIALTGGLSCGKSSVCKLLKEFGAYVVSADDIVHDLLSQDQATITSIIELLGKGVVVNKQLNRSRIADKVFQNDELLEALEQLLHPKVYQRIEDQYQQIKLHPFSFPYFIAEIPLFFETEPTREKNWHFDLSIAVVADPKLSLERSMARINFNQDHYQKKLSRQLPLIEKAIRADYVITNSGSFEHLRESVKELHDELTH